MPNGSPARLFSWAELPRENAEVTFESFADEGDDWVEPVRVDYPATSTLPARAFIPHGNRWVEVAPDTQEPLTP